METVPETLYPTSRIILLGICVLLLWEEVRNLRAALRTGSVSCSFHYEPSNMAISDTPLKPLSPLEQLSFDTTTERIENSTETGTTDAVDKAIIIQPQQTHQESQETRERTALVMRAVDPIQPCLLQRVLQVAKAVQTNSIFQNYEFHLLVDQTKNKTTNRTLLSRYFQEQNASDLELPSIFGVSEERIRQEFPELSNGYMAQKLVDGTLAENPKRTFMWQLMTPAIVVFSHAHPEYDYTWVFEDDVWSMGKPLIELFRIWDDQMKMKPLSTDLAVLRNRRSGVPYNKKMEGKHSIGF